MQGNEEVKKANINAKNSIINGIKKTRFVNQPEYRLPLLVILKFSI